MSEKVERERESAVPLSAYTKAPSARELQPATLESATTSVVPDALNIGCVSSSSHAICVPCTCT
eukprot:2459546-Rhodomonas_salina.1